MVGLSCLELQRAVTGSTHLGWALISLSPMRACCLLGITLALAACATAPKGWTRLDGKPIDPVQLEADQTICKGEVEKAAVQGGSKSTFDAPFGNGPAG